MSEKCACCGKAAYVAVREPPLLSRLPHWRRRTLAPPCLRHAFGADSGMLLGLQERVCVLGKTYHKGCFRCTACNTILILSNYLDHKNEPYCKGCYSGRAGPSGFRKGVMNSFPSRAEVNKAEEASRRAAEEKKQLEAEKEAARIAAEKEAARLAAEEEAARVAAEQEAARVAAEKEAARVAAEEEAARVAAEEEAARIAAVEEEAVRLAAAEEAREAEAAAKRDARKAKLSAQIEESRLRDARRTELRLIEEGIARKEAEAARRKEEAARTAAKKEAAHIAINEEALIAPKEEDGFMAAEADAAGGQAADKEGSYHEEAQTNRRGETDAGVPGNESCVSPRSTEDSLSARLARLQNDTDAASKRLAERRARLKAAAEESKKRTEERSGLSPGPSSPAPASPKPAAPTDTAPASATAVKVELPDAPPGEASGGCCASCSII